MTAVNVIIEDPAVLEPGPEPSPAARAPLDQVDAHCDSLTEEHDALRQRIAELETLIASVPETLERRRSRYRDMLPPADLAFNARSTDQPTFGRQSRSQRHAERQAKLSRALVLVGILAAAVALVLAVAHLASGAGIGS